MNYFKFYLGAASVEEPDGIAGMSFVKPRNMRLNGILRKNIGKMQGIGSVLFKEPLAVGILKEAWKKDKLNANVPFKMQQIDGAILIDGKVNFSNFRETREGWFVTFEDSGGVEEFLANIDNEKEVNPLTPHLLPAYELLEKSTHELPADAAPVVYKKPVAVSLQHAIPWKAKASKSESGGEYHTVTTLAPVWTNTTNAARLVNVEAKVVFSHKTSASKTVRVCVLVKNSGVTLTDITSEYISVTSTEAESTVLVKEAINVPANADVFVFVDSADTDTNFRFTYSDKSYLYIGVSEETADTAPLTFRANDLLAALTDMPLTATLLQNDYITDGLRLRGASGKGLIASFGKVWDDLSKLYGGLILNVNQDATKLTVSRLEDYIKSCGVSLDLGDPVYYETGPCTDVIFNGVVAGCNRWQSETPTGGDEENAVAKWITAQRKSEKLLNAECQTLTASKRLIEKMRRKQFREAGTSATSDDSDDRQLVIIRDNTGSRWNLDFTPAQIAEALKWLWSTSGALFGTGGYKEGGATNADIQAGTPLFTGDSFAGEFTIDGAKWVQLGDVVRVFCDNQYRKIWVTEAVYTPGAAGSGQESNLQVYGWILNS